MTARVIVQYPAEFRSIGKFQRKLETYISRLTDVQISTSVDANHFVSDFCQKRELPFDVGELKFREADYAVIFDSGKLFTETIAALRAHRVPCKVVGLQLTSVVNKDKGESFDVYIGRGTIWGNPYPIGREGDREEVLRKYQYDFDRRLLRFFENHDKNVEAIRGKVLGCHCKPSACHGDILANYVNSIDDGK